MTAWTIYRIYRRSTQETIYVGITRQPLENRLKDHKRHSAKSNRKLVDMLSRYDGDIAIDGIDCCIGTRKDAEAREREWIYYYLERNQPLLNNKHIPPIGDLPSFLRGTFLSQFQSAWQVYRERVFSLAVVTATNVQMFQRQALEYERMLPDSARTGD